MPDRADQQVLPRRLERAGAAVQADERRADQRGRLDGDPQQADVPADADQRHGREESGQAGREHRLAARSGRLGGLGARDARCDRPATAADAAKSTLAIDSIRSAGGVERDPVAERCDRAGPTQHQATSASVRAPRRRRAARRRLAAGPERERAGAAASAGTSTRRQGHGCQSFRSASRSVSMWSNSRLMWNTVMPITKTADEDVEQDAHLDEQRLRARRGPCPNA